MASDLPPLWTPSKTLSKRPSSGHSQHASGEQEPHETGWRANAESEPSSKRPADSRALQWRLALAEACAELLESSLESLRHAYAEYLQHGDLGAPVQGRSRNTVPSRARLLEDLGLNAPRDFVDYVLMRTLRERDALAMQNSRSWTFNLMDRSGEGRAYLAEFVRYAPLMTPVADSAVVELVFQTLSEASSKAATDSMYGGDKTGKFTERQNVSLEQRDMDFTSGTLTEGEPSEAHVSFAVWDEFLIALGKIFSKTKPEWTEAKRLFGIDHAEPLVKAGAAFDHSGTIPIFGKLFLSERYLCFAASLGWGHFLVPLSMIREVKSTELPVLRRDAVVISFTVPKNLEKNVNGPFSKLLPTGAIDKGLVLSFNEFRSTRLRDAWVMYIREMVAAHVASKQHHVDHLDANIVMSVDETSSSVRFRQALDLAETTRFAEEASPGVTQQRGQRLSRMRDCSPNASPAASTTAQTAGVKVPASSFEAIVQHPTPAFARIARLNILRSRALKRVLSGRLPRSLFIFSVASEADVVVEHHPMSVDDLRGRELRRAAFRKYVDAAHRITAGERSWWFVRAMQRVNMNMEANRRRQGDRDTETLDIVSLGNQISTFIELVAPIGCMLDAVCYVIRWDRPAVSAAIFLFLLFVVLLDAVTYLIPLAILGYCGLLLSVRKAVQNPKHESLSESSKMKASYLSGFFVRIHHGLVATQVWLQHMNRHLEKFESIHLWRDPARTRQYIYGLVVSALLIAVVPFRWIFAALVIYLFTLQFRDPERQDFIDRWYASVPGRPSCT